MSLFITENESEESNETSRTLLNLQPNSRYMVRVRAINSLGVVSDWSETTVISLPGDSSIPSAPQNLVTDFDSIDFVISWDPVLTNEDDTLLQDFSHYQISIISGVDRFIYKSLVPTYTYTYAQNKADFGTVKEILGVQIRTVDIEGNKSEALVGSDENEKPDDPTEPPVLSATFSSINVTIPDQGIDDLKNYPLFHSLDNSIYNEIALLRNGVDSYTYSVSDDDTHYFKYRVRDQFNRLSDYSPAASISATNLSDIDAVRGTGVTDIVALTQAAYDALTPDPTTLYYIIP